MNVVDISDFKQVKAGRNYVLAELDAIYNETIDAGGVELILDTSYEKERHSAVNAIVVSTPKDLYYSPEASDQSIEFDTEMELEMGDKIFFHYLAISNALEEGRVFNKNGKFYIFLKYDRIFCAERNGYVFGINGWLLINPIVVENEYEGSGLEIQEHLKNQESLQEGTIAYTSSPLMQYKFEKRYGSELDTLNTGDNIVFSQDSDIPIEYELHQSIDSKKRYFRLQRKDILGTYNLN